MNLQQISDKAAIGLSALCIVHCLLTPVLLLLLPAASSLMAINDDVFHLWLLYAVVPISVFALVMGFYQHRSLKLVTAGAGGLLLLVIAAVGGHENLGENGEVVLTVLGSVTIAIVHLRNVQLRPSRRKAEADTHTDAIRHES